MKKGFATVLVAQALSAIADNALFIAAVAMIAQLDGPGWMTPLMKWFFALAYVLLAAYVGAIADSFPKGRVMFVTNAIKLGGCLTILIFSFLDTSFPEAHAYIICISYGVVGIGAAAYSPAKYGIVTEMLPPKELVKGNSYIEGLTILSIIVGTVLGGALIKPDGIGQAMADLPILSGIAHSPAEVAVIIVALIYVLASLCNLIIPNTHYAYPKQETRIVPLTRQFAGYVKILWKDKVGQISLAVTTLFWGAGGTIQVLIIKWADVHLDLGLESASMMQGIAAIGTVIGAVIAARIPLTKALNVLPVGILMGLSVMLLLVVKSDWAVYSTLVMIGALSGFFVVPMNAVLQHRGHVLLSAGHSIAVQNLNEQFNILLMVGIYTIMLGLGLSIYTIIVIFAVIVAALMALIMYWCKYNEKHYPEVFEQIGDTSHGQSL